MSRVVEWVNLPSPCYNMRSSVIDDQMRAEASEFVDALATKHQLTPAVAGVKLGGSPPATAALRKLGRVDLVPCPGLRIRVPLALPVLHDDCDLLTLHWRSQWHATLK